MDKLDELNEIREALTEVLAKLNVLMMEIALEERGK